MARCWVFAKFKAEVGRAAATSFSMSLSVMEESGSFLGSFLAGFAGFSLVDASLGEVGWTMLASPTASEDFCSCLDLMKEKDRLFL